MQQFDVKGSKSEEETQEYLLGVDDLKKLAEFGNENHGFAQLS